MGFLDWFMKNEMPKGTFTPVNSSEFTSTNASGVTAKNLGFIPPSPTAAPGMDIIGKAQNLGLDIATNLATTWFIGFTFKVFGKITASPRLRAMAYAVASKLGTRFVTFLGLGTTATTVHETSIDQKVFDKLFTPIVNQVPLSVPNSTATNVGLKALEVIKAAAAPALIPPSPVVAPVPVPTPAPAVVPISSPVTETVKTVVTNAVSSPEVVTSVWTFSNILMVAGFFFCSAMLIYYYAIPAVGDKLVDTAMANKKLEYTPTKVTKSQILNEVFAAKQPLKGGLDIVYKGMPCNVPPEYISKLPKAPWGGIDHAQMDNVFRFAIDEETKVAKIVGLVGQTPSKGIIEIPVDVKSSLPLDQKAEMVKQAKKGLEKGAELARDVVDQLVNNLPPT